MPAGGAEGGREQADEQKGPRAVVSFLPEKTVAEGGGKGGGAARQERRDF